MVLRFFRLSTGSCGGFISVLGSLIRVPECSSVILWNLTSLCSRQNLWRKALFTGAFTRSRCETSSLTDVTSCARLHGRSEASALFHSHSSWDVKRSLDLPKVTRDCGLKRKCFTIHILLPGDAFCFLKLVAIHSENSSLEKKYIRDSHISKENN